MTSHPARSRFLTFHSFVALALTAGVFGLCLAVWLAARPFHRPQQPSFGILLLTSLPMAALVGAGYWYLARQVARGLDQLVPLKTPEPLPAWQRDSVRRVVGRVQLLGFGMLVVVGTLAAALRFLFPEAGSTSVVFLVLYLLLPPGIVSFAYRQGVHDAQRAGTDSSPSEPKT